MPMAAYLVVVNDVSHAAGLTKGAEIIDWLLSSRIWIFPAAASGAARKLVPDDALVIYLAGKRAGSRSFVGHATVASSVAPLAGSLRSSAHALGLEWFDQFVHLKTVQRWEQPRPIEDLIPKLSFIADKKNYGLALRLGFRRLNDADYQTIIRGSKRNPRPSRTTR